MNIFKLRAKCHHALDERLGSEDTHELNYEEWVLALEKRIYERLSLSFENDLPPLEEGWEENDDHELIVPEEYVDLYTFYAIAKAFLQIGEYEKYNIYIQLHKEVYDTFMREYAQRHMPKPVYLKY